MFRFGNGKNWFRERVRVLIRDVVMVEVKIMHMTRLGFGLGYALGLCVRVRDMFRVRFG